MAHHGCDGRRAPRASPQLGPRSRRGDRVARPADGAAPRARGVRASRARAREELGCRCVHGAAGPRAEELAVECRGAGGDRRRSRTAARRVERRDRGGGPGGPRQGRRCRSRRRAAPALVAGRGGDAGRGRRGAGRARARRVPRCTYRLDARAVPAARPGAGRPHDPPRAAGGRRASARNGVRLRRRSPGGRAQRPGHGPLREPRRAIRVGRNRRVGAAAPARGRQPADGRGGRRSERGRRPRCRRRRERRHDPRHCATSASGTHCAAGRPAHGDPPDRRVAGRPPARGGPRGAVTPDLGPRGARRVSRGAARVAGARRARQRDETAAALVRPSHPPGRGRARHRRVDRGPARRHRTQRSRRVGRDGAPDRDPPQGAGRAAATASRTGRAPGAEARARTSRRGPARAPRPGDGRRADDRCAGRQRRAGWKGGGSHPVLGGPAGDLRARAAVRVARARAHRCDRGGGAARLRPVSRERPPQPARLHEP